MSQQPSWTLEFNTVGMREPHQVSFEREMVIGRGGPDIHVGFDLGPYNAVEKGVSRQHVKIMAENDHLYVQDLGAANGSMLNEKRLQPDQRYHLNNNDTLTLGALKVSVRVVGKPTLGSAPRKQTDVARKRISGIPGQGEMVLIVEDHVEVAQLFSMMLQRQGFITQISRDANRALHFLQTQRPNAVVLDMMLPGIDGLEVCRYIRRDSTMDTTPVVAVSANRNPEVESDVMGAGADIFLSKPVNASELGTVVAELINRRRTNNKPVKRPKPDHDSTKALDATLKASTTPVREDTVAVIVAGYTDKPFTLSLRRPMTFGRSTSNNPATHVDLSGYDASNRGVSRVHMLMSYEDGTFLVEDAGSLNGTYIGGKHIEPHKPTQIYSGQEVRVGQLSMFVYFLSEEQQKSIESAPAMTSLLNVPQATPTFDHETPDETKPQRAGQTNSPNPDKATDKLAEDETDETAEDETPKEEPLVLGQYDVNRLYSSQAVDDDTGELDDTNELDDDDDRPKRDTTNLKGQRAETAILKDEETEPDDEDS